jgi:hypothetical protein
VQEARGLEGLLKLGDPDVFLGTGISLGGDEHDGTGGTTVTRDSGGGIHVNCSAPILTATALDVIAGA